MASGNGYRAIHAIVAERLMGELMSELQPRVLSDKFHSPLSTNHEGSTSFKSMSYDTPMRSARKDRSTQGSTIVDAELGKDHVYKHPAIDFEHGPVVSIRLVQEELVSSIHFDFEEDCAPRLADIRLSCPGATRVSRARNLRRLLAQKADASFE
eukprot:TRINITY_DN34224_c0_g1_i1.p1 TRINITY_DN34224_c0_g1~~TRINITY_DN34224_c0_g1_i1.p1  ORF type:complete len:154 (+),score=21.16 TRINITY_DN34224_c0_g1_i1:49-510(+)